MDNIYTVLITAITILGRTAAFRFYDKKLRKKERDEDFIRNDCKDRIVKLEVLLMESSHEKDELRDMVLELTKEVASLRTKVEFFEKNKKSTIAAVVRKSKKNINN